jgi:predicted neuraminidase
MNATELPATPRAIAAAMDGQLRTVEGGRGVAVLPSPCVQNHAAFLARHPQQGLSCVWFAGGLEGKADICIHLSHFDEAAGRWSPARRISDDPHRSEQNPIWFQPGDGRVLLFHTAQPGGDQDRCVVRMREIGREPRDLPLPRGSFIRAAPQIRPDGAWLHPDLGCRACAAHTGAVGR